MAAAASPRRSSAALQLPSEDSDAVTPLQVVNIFSVDENQLFYFTSAASESGIANPSLTDSLSLSGSTLSLAPKSSVSNAVEGPPGLNEALELVLVPGGTALRSYARPTWYLTARLQWAADMSNAARWHLGRPAAPAAASQADGEVAPARAVTAATLELLQRNIFMAFDPSSRRFRLTRGVHPESILQIKAVPEDDKQSWKTLESLRQLQLRQPGTQSGRSGGAEDNAYSEEAEERRRALVRDLVRSELEYGSMLEELQTTYMDALAADLTADEADQIFINVPDILRFQLNLCAGFREANISELFVSAIFLKALPTIERLYCAFATKVIGSRDTLANKLHEQDFRDALDEQQEKASAPLTAMLEAVAGRVFHYKEQFTALTAATAVTDSRSGVTAQVLVHFQRIAELLRVQVQAQVQDSYTAIVHDQIHVQPDHVPSKDFVLDNGRRKIVAIVLVDMWPMIKLRATFGRKQIAKNAAVGSRAAHLIAMDDLILLVDESVEDGRHQYQTCAKVLMLKDLTTVTHEDHFHITAHRKELYDICPVNAHDRKVLVDLLSATED